MRRHQATRPRPVLATLCGAALALGLAPAPAQADVSREEAGRATRTGPKQPQREYNGVLIDPTAAEQRLTPRASGRRLSTAGRGVRSEPTLRVSVGVVGCPGCSEALGQVLLIHRTSPRGRAQGHN